MALNLALAIVAGIAAVMFIQNSVQRFYALGAIAAAALIALMQLHVVTIRIEAITLVAWAAIAVLGTLILARQTTRNGGAAAAAMVFSSAIPLARICGLIN